MKSKKFFAFSMNKTFMFLSLILTLCFAILVDSKEVSAEGLASAPEVSFSTSYTDATWNTSPFYFTVSGSDLKPSEKGEKKYRYMVNGNGKWNVVNGEVYWNTDTIESTVKVQAYDTKDSSNYSESFEFIVRYDGQAPSISNVKVQGGHMTVTAKDEISGVALYGWSNSAEVIPKNWQASADFEIKNPGTYYLFVKDYAENVGLYSKPVSIAVPIESCIIDPIQPCVYAKRELKPDLNITYNGVKLVEYTDYTIKLEKNIDVGEAKVTILGTGGYTGKVVKTFNITKATQEFKSEDQFKIKVTSSGFTPVVKLKWGDGDFSFKSSNSSIFKVNAKTGKIYPNKIGKATLTVTSSETDNFKQTSKDITVYIIPKQVSKVGCASNKKGQIKVTWKNDTGIGGYLIYLSRDSKFDENDPTTKVYKVSGAKKNKKIIKGLKKGKKYYVRVAAYKNYKGERIISSYSTKASCVVSSKNKKTKSNKKK